MLVGCNYEDPVWEMPCDQRPQREIIPGTGEKRFHPADEKPLEIQYGSQGGSHIWFASGLGTANGALDATSTVWRFFSELG